MLLLFEIPVVKDHTHRYDVGFGQGIFEEIAGGCPDAVAEPGGRDVFLCDRLRRRQIEGSAVKMRMLLRGFNTQQAGCSTDVAEGPKVRKIELGDKGFEIEPGEAGHRTHELFESR